jgi:hypothetical protein
MDEAAGLPTWSILLIFPHHNFVGTMGSMAEYGRVGRSSGGPLPPYSSVFRITIS